MELKFMYGATELRSERYDGQVPLPRIDEAIVLDEWNYLVIDVIHDYNTDVVSVHLQTT